MQFGRIFQGRLWFKKGCFANDDDDTHQATVQSAINWAVLMGHKHAMRLPT
jgi:hypothetical protein